MWQYPTLGKNLIELQVKLQQHRCRDLVEQFVQGDTRLDISAQVFTRAAQRTSDCEWADRIALVVELGLFQEHGHTLLEGEQFARAAIFRFSESLALECEADDVRVCALCPGLTYSEFHDVTGTRAQLASLPGWMWMSAERVVREGLVASAAGRLIHIPGRINRTLAALAACLPRALVQHLSRRESRRFRDTR